MSMPNDPGVFRTHRRGIALSLGLLLLTLLAGTGLLGLAGHFLTAAALAGSGALGFNLFGPSAGIRALTFVRILSRYGEKLFGHDVTLRIARDLRLQFFRRALPLAPLGLGRFRTGDLLARLVADIERVDGLLVRAFGPLLALAVLALLACVVAAFALPAAGALLLVAASALVAGVPWLSARGARLQEHRRAEARAALRADVLDAVEGATDLSAMQADGAWIERVDTASAALAGCERQRKQRLALGTLAHGGIAAVTVTAMLWLLLEAAHRGTLSAPAAAGLFFMTVALLEACAGAALAWRELQAGLASSRRLREVVAATPAVVDPAMPTPVPTHSMLEFDAIGFHWPQDPRLVLDRLQLRIASGQRVAIRGDSGAGKSSLLALTLRLCDPQYGQVRYGGTDLRDFAQADWHRQIAWLPQEAPVFAGSVRDNLRMGDPQADDARLWAALAQVRMDAAIRALPGGLGAWIGEHGRSLSAGQARRIALARALLRASPILLLDEPTEGLDTDTAADLLRDIASASAGRSVLLISHDELPPGTVHAQYRLVAGRLVEEALPRLSLLPPGEEPAPDSIRGGA